MILGMLVMGIVAAVVGTGTAIGARRDLRLRARILAAPTVPIARADAGGEVEIKGRVALSDGEVTAPFSGRRGVWVRTVVQHYQQRGRSGRWVTLVDEVNAVRSFLVDDGSGQRARVLPSGARVLVDARTVASSGTFRDPPPPVAAFLASRGIGSTTMLGFNKSMRYREEVLAAGEMLYALGPSRRDPGAPVPDGYRMAPSTELVVFSMGSGDGELTLSNKSEAELTSRLLRGLVIGIGIDLAAIVLIVVGLVVR